MAEKTIIPSAGPKLSRRSFVAGAGIAAIGQSVAWADDSIPPTFIRSSDFFILQRATEELWVIDRRWFDLDSGNIAVQAKGSRLKISGLLGGSNVALDLSITVRENDWLAFSSFGGPDELVTLGDFRRLGVKILLRTKNLTTLPVRVKAASDIRATLTYPFNVGAAAALAFEGSDIGWGTAAGLSTTVSSRWDETEPEIDQLVPGARPLTRFILEGVTVADPQGWDFGGFGGRVLRLFFGKGSGRISLERIATASGRARILRRSGNARGAKGARLRYGDQQWGRDLYLSAVEAIQVVGGSLKQRGLKIAQSAEPVYVEADKFGAAIRVSRDCFFPGYRQQSQLVLPIELLLFHARGKDKTRFDVDFRNVRTDKSGLAVGEPGLNRSAPVWNAEGTSGVAGALSLGVRGAIKDESWLHLGERDAARIVLDRPGAVGIEPASPWLRLRRSIDGLDLGLLFYKFRIEIGEEAKLVAMDGAQRGVRFSPQHLEEECFTIEPKLPLGWFVRLGKLLSSTALTQPSLRPLGSSKDATWFPGAPVTLIARTRAAGDSRIIFAPESATEFELTADALTNWADQELVVADRAVGEIPIDDQLALMNITQETTREVARKKIEDGLRQPRADETSLELVTGLFFSPEKSARFRTTAPSESPPALWTAQLDLNPASEGETGGNSSSVVRAIWASGLDAGFLFNPDGLALDPDPFAASTSSQDRIEIALQSSAFGLAALRSTTKQGVDVPNSRVRRVSDKWTFVDKKQEPSPDDPNLKVVQEGVFSPAPFKSFTARLTSFGGDLDAEWQAEPIQPFTRAWEGPFFQRPFTVERYVHRTRLRSDTIAQVVYKGFLFPYGFRVSLVKISQREPAVLPEFGAMMPLVTRYFIVPKPVTKTFPGIYQPFEARGVPLRSARLLGDRTPELDPGSMLPPPGLVLPSDAGNPENKERVFWPVLRAGGRLQFDFIADDLDTRRTVPMLFVSNKDAGQPASVRAIIEFYNRLAEEDRWEDHHRGKTIYAPERSGANHGANESGTTSFETDHIILQARPRSLNAGTIDADAPYSFDTFMAGVDEPPFYPVMEQASISVPPLDQMMGSPQGLHPVGYNGTYLRNGFDQSQNKAELFLDFLDVKLMSLGGDGRISGGIAQPQNYAAGISRINAVVGAQKKESKLAARTFADMPDGIDSPWNFDSIQKQFDPKAFFRDAKLFGIVDLSEVIEAAAIEAQPKLKQVFEYGLGNGIGVLEGACSSAGRLIGVALEEADRKLKAVFASSVGGGLPIDPSQVSIERFYPDLTKQLQLFKELLEEGVGGSDPITWVNDLIVRWKPVKASIDAVIANPSPEPLRAGMAELRAFVDTLQASFGRALRETVANATASLTNGAIEALIEEIVSASFDGGGTLSAPWFYEALTGAVPAAGTSADDLRRALRSIFNDPAASGAKVGEAILARAFMQPVLSMLAQAKDIENTIAEQGGSAVAGAVRAAAPLLQKAASMIVEVDVLVDAARNNAGELCSAAGSALRLEELCKLLADLAPGDSDLDKAVATLRQAWPTLDLPNLPDTPGVIEARQASQALRRTVADLQSALNAFADVRRELAALKLDKLCREQPQYLVTLGARLLSVRKTVISAFQRCVKAAGNLTDIYARLPSTGMTDALAEMEALRLQVLSLAANLTFKWFNNIDQRISWMDAVPVVGQRVRSVKSQVLAAVADIRTKVAAATGKTQRELEDIVTAATDLSSAERRLFELASDLVALTKPLQTIVEKTRQDVLTFVAQPVIIIHAKILDLANQAIAVFDSAPDLVKLFTSKVYARLVVARDNIKRDSEALNMLATGSGSTEISALLARWSRGEFGLVDAVDLVLEFFTAIMTGQIGGVFDLAGVRRAVEEAVKQLLPTRVNTSFDFRGGLKKWQIFDPQGDKSITLTTHISADLLKLSDRKVDVTGRISPFRLNLLESPDLVTISFSETTFTFEGFVPKFKTQIDAVTPGSDLSFFNNIADALDLDANIYARPTSDPAGIRVGYSYSKDFLELGGVQILNFAFDASLALFLDGSPAVAHVQIADREAPCGLIVPPFYYGAAYIALTTTPRTITAFEIQLEFGVARALKFGPLSGHASVSAGIYLMSAVTETGRTTRLEGFVHALGEGSIACFGVAVNFEVKVVHQGGDVEGSATYRFSFRIGFVKVGYGVTANYTFAGGSSAEPASAKISAGAPKCSVLPDKTKEWLCYRDHFVTDWPET